LEVAAVVGVFFWLGGIPLPGVMVAALVTFVVVTAAWYHDG